MTEPTYRSECEQMLADAIEILRTLNSAVWLNHPAWAVASPETARASEAIAAYESWVQQFDGSMRDD